MINLLRIWIQDNNEEAKQKEILFEGKRQAFDEICFFACCRI